MTVSVNKQRSERIANSVKQIGGQPIPCYKAGCSPHVLVTQSLKRVG